MAVRNRMRRLQGVGAKEDARGAELGEGQKAVRTREGLGTGGPRTGHPNETPAFLSSLACCYHNFRAEQAWFSS